MAMVTHTVVPIGHPKRPLSLFDEVPLFCGARRTPETHVTHFSNRITCKRCKMRQDVYDEDLEHKRNMQRLAIMKQIEAAPA